MSAIPTDYKYGSWDWGIFAHREYCFCQSIYSIQVRPIGASDSILSHVDTPIGSVQYLVLKCAGLDQYPGRPVHNLCFLVWWMGVDYELFCATLCTRSDLLVIRYPTRQKNGLLAVSRVGKLKLFFRLLEKLAPRLCGINRNLEECIHEKQTREKYQKFSTKQASRAIAKAQRV